MWLAVGVLFLVPALAALLPALTQPNAIAGILELARSAVFGRTLAFTASQAFLAALVCTIFAVPGAYVVYRRGTGASSLVKVAVMVPFVLPGVIVVLSLITFMGRSGWLSSIYNLITGSIDGTTVLYGFWGIVFAHVYYNMSLCLRVVGSSWSRLDTRIVDAARVLGASSWRITTSIIEPILRPSITYGFAMAFIYSALGFTTVLIFGGGLYRTIEVAIYMEVATTLDFVKASQWAFLQTLFLLAVISIVGIISARQHSRSMAFGATAANGMIVDMRHSRSIIINIAVKAYGFLLVGFSVSPLLSLVAKGSWREFSALIAGRQLGNLGIAAGETVMTSLGFALVTTCLTCSLAFTAASSVKGKRWSTALSDTLLILPITISPLCFGLGVARLFDGLPTALGIVLYQTFLAFPVVYSIARIALRELSPTYSEAAVLLGANQWRLLTTIRFPLLKNSVLTAFAYGFAISFGDFAGVALLGRGQVITLPVAIYRLIGHYNYQQAIACGSLMVVVLAAVFLTFEALLANGMNKSQKRGNAFAASR